jgi:hypothetical protein
VRQVVVARAAMTASCKPWKCASNFTMCCRPVTARATRMASAVVSVPVIMKRTRSAPGTMEQISSAQRTSISEHAL